MTNVHPEPYRQTTDPAAIEDLRRRLRATRWPDAPEDAGWTAGVDLTYMRELVRYWAEEFDWFAQERELNRLPRFRATVDALGVHYIHAHAADSTQQAIPVVLCHGWPDSFWRYSKVISLLTDPAAHGCDPADAFDVVVPDMPGHGYSDRPRGRALDSTDVASMWATLMGGLGYDSFFAAGGDKGSLVCRYLALEHAEQVRAVHRTDAGLPVFDGDRSKLSDIERNFLDGALAWGATEGAYGLMHRTKPQTAAFGLHDSPVGLAAWIVEKMQAWSDCAGDIEKSYTKDEILTNVTIYWLTGTIGSSMRMYRADAAIAREKQLKGWRRSKKIALIERGNPTWQDLSKDWYDVEPADLKRATGRMNA